MFPSAGFRLPAWDRRHFEPQSVPNVWAVLGDEEPVVLVRASRSAARRSYGRPDTFGAASCRVRVTSSEGSNPSLRCRVATAARP